MALIGPKSPIGLLCSQTVEMATLVKGLSCISEYQGSDPSIHSKKNSVEFPVYIPR